MSALLHPIHGAREKCRPKHQVLVLRCYPKFQKNVQEVKPNSSELSYLLYYASSRRTKLQKVGAFLEKKTASDVWRKKLGNVQVTLQILTSIIEKAPRDLTLYGGSVLTILGIVLGSKDVNMVEESIETFESYCRHADAASLSADQTRLRQYLSIIQQYTAFGSTGSSTQSASPTAPSTTRRRNIGLKAIRAVVGSDALVAETSDQLNAVMPLILENLHLDREDGLTPLEQKATHGEKQSLEMARKRRMSTTSVPTVDEPALEPATAAETTADADKQAEEDVRVLAVRCLQQIFSVSTGASRAQLRLATTLVLRYIVTREQPSPSATSASTESTRTTPDWATMLFETIARWTPVQDRFIIVIVTVEALVRSSIVESVLDKQLVLARLVDWLLKSDINLIGLSVMDVLLRLVQHMLLLLQLGERDSNIIPASGRGDTLGLFKDILGTFDPPNTATVPDRGRTTQAKENVPSAVRKELLDTLQKCITGLATHIYYTDQISDMLTAIMARLKPSIASDIPTAAAAINDPSGATKAIADSAGLNDDPTTDRFFSFATARVVALKAVKGIIQTANSKKTSTGTSAEVRSRVGVQVWEGTQWLLKDEVEEVRMAYVDALLTWLRLETNRNDLLLPSDGAPRKSRASKRETVNANREMSIAKRAVSNASKIGEKQKQSTFLQLLHLAIFDDAVEHADSDASIQLLHLLLWTQVDRLGVNAIRTGLPMILNLQGTVLNANDHSPAAKTRVASLVHGYLWAIVEKFDFMSSTVGAEVNSEIARRRHTGCWFDKIKFPPSSISQGQVSMPEQNSHSTEESANSLRPFLNIDTFVEEIANGYDKALSSPAASPPSSPGRVFSIPTLGFGYGYTAANVHKPSPENQMPVKVKEEMCGTWSREACIAAVEKENNPSLAGSRTAPSSNGRRYLSATQQNGTSSPSSPHDPSPPQGLPLFSGLGSLTRAREISTHSSVREADTSSRDSTTRVADLKRALSGANGNLRGYSPLRRPVSRSRRSTRSSGSESMLSWNPADDESIGEAEADRSRPPTAAGAKLGGTFHDKVTSKSTSDDVPPVPPIPSALNLPMAGTFPRDTSPHKSNIAQSRNGVDSDDMATTARPMTSSAANVKKHRPASRAGAASVTSYSTTGRKADLSALLANIQIEDTAQEKGRSISGGLHKPPY